MRIRSALSGIPLGAVMALLAGCATMAPEPTGPVVSPTGIVYEPGTPPSTTRYAEAAALYLARELYDDALRQAREGIEADPGNPIHFYLAGVAHIGLDEYLEADQMWLEAERIYPAYELEIEPRREVAWADGFNRGLEAYEGGEVAETIRIWELAIALFDLRPHVHQNLAGVLMQEGEYERAMEVYQEGLDGLEKRMATRILDEEALEERQERRIAMEESLAQLLLFDGQLADAEALLARQLERNPGDVRTRSELAAAIGGQPGREAEAAEMYADLLSIPELDATQLQNIGTSLFGSGDFVRSAEAFRRLTELQPYGRDAWFNYANALYGAERWEDLLEVGERLQELDPLNEHVGLILARAHLELGDDPAALDALERSDRAPAIVEALQMRTLVTQTMVSGRLLGNNGNEAEAGSGLDLRFSFYDDARPLGTETVRLTVPVAGESEAFEVPFDAPATAFRYEVLQEEESNGGVDELGTGEPDEIGAIPLD